MRVDLGMKQRLRRLFGGRRGRSGMTPAARETVVDIVFRAALGRRPDPSGLATYVAAMRDGTMLPKDVLAEVKNSHEGHRARTLDCTSLIVPALYEALLGRAPSPDEVNHWRARADATGGVGAVVRGILEMPETSSAQLRNAIAHQGMQALFLAEYRRAGVIDG